MVDSSLEIASAFENSPVIHTPVAGDDELRFIECRACGGDCGHEVVTHYRTLDGAPDGWFEYCTWCHGTGVEEVELQPIDQDDLDEGWPG